MERLALHIEALIFAADQPITVDEIKKVLEKAAGIEISKFEIETAVNDLVRKYQSNPDASFEIVNLAGGYQFFSKNDYQSVISELLKDKLNKRLSTNQLEVLSIIAYKQPISKPEIEQIRGVNCDYSIQKLLEKELIVIGGRSEAVGKAILYEVSPFFMNYFGINSVSDLPKLKDFEQPVENSIGVISEN